MPAQPFRHSPTSPTPQPALRLDMPDPVPTLWTQLDPLTRRRLAQRLATLVSRLHPTPAGHAGSVVQEAVDEH